MDITENDVVLSVLNKAPFQMKIMNVSEKIKKEGLRRVISTSIYSPNSREFHPNGLFSEDIFGRITSTERFTTLAYISLNTQILHPQVFTSLISKKKLYESIMSGFQYAKFDKEDNDFVVAKPDDPNADTGFGFFLKYIPQISKNEIKSVRKQPINILLEKYKDSLMIKEVIVLPAGMRDIVTEAGRLSQDDINKIYLSILSISMGLSEHALSEDRLFDSIRYALQKRVNDVFNYIMNLMEGKRGFIQEHYGKRKVAFGTRNVASAAIMKSNTPNDPSTIKFDETKLPMMSVMKELQPLMIHFLKNLVYGEVFSTGATTVQAIDPKTHTMKYIQVSPKEVRKRTTSKGIEDLINKFKQIRFRDKSVAVFDSEGNEYWIYMIYDLGNRVYMFKTIEELHSLMNKMNDTNDIDSSKIRSLTWSEVVYIGTCVVSKDKHAFITRYPAIEDGSIFPSKIHVLSTTPDRKVEVVSLAQTFILPHYPILGSKFHDSLMVHPSKLAGLGMDFDGDTGSINALMADDTNEEVANYLNSARSIIDDNMQLKLGEGAGIVEFVVSNLSK